MAPLASGAKMTLGALRRQAAERLREAGVEGAAHEAALLMQHVLRCGPGEMLLADTRAASAAQCRVIGRYLRRRLKGEPLQLILGEWSFMGLDVRVRRGVLIPRQDTETLCEEALRVAKERGCRTALELGTGSGALAVSLARLGGLDVTATDISLRALSLARENASRNGVSLTLRRGNWFEAVKGRVFDLIVSNPPYIRAGDIPGLMREVREYDPHAALCGGADGLDAYRAIIANAMPHASPNGALLLEVGAGQANDVRELLERAGWAGSYAVRDLAGIERVVGALYPDTVDAANAANENLEV